MISSSNTKRKNRIINANSNLIHCQNVSIMSSFGNSKNKLILKFTKYNIILSLYSQGYFNSKKKKSKNIENNHDSQSSKNFNLTNN